MILRNTPLKLIEKEKLMKKIYLILFLISTYTHVLAQEFKLAFTSGNDKYFIREEGNNEAWLKEIRPLKKIKNKAGKWISTGGGFTLHYIKCNKNNRTYAIGETIIYDAKGNVKNRVEGSLYLTNKIIPDSIIEGVCKVIFNEEQYEKDINQEKLDKTLGDLDDFVDRYDNHREGFVQGYLEEKCKPYTIYNCNYKKAPEPEESFFADDPKDDYTKGYYDGMNFAKKEKTK